MVTKEVERNQNIVRRRKQHEVTENEYITGILMN
jgi:hypothetical protein